MLPQRARTQQSSQTTRIGILSEFPRAIFLPLLAALRESGLVEGQQFVVEDRGFNLRTDQLPLVAREFATKEVSVIFCSGTAAIRAAQSATSTIPILGGSEDMLGTGIVKSLAHPEGNVSGFSLFVTELDGKRQEIVQDLIPGARRVALLVDPVQTVPRKWEVAEAVARNHGIEVDIRFAAEPNDVALALETAARSGAAAINVLGSPRLASQAREIAERANSLKLPAMFQWPDIAQQGGLVAYGPRLGRLLREISAPQVIKVLHGVKLSDIPVEQPTSFELVLNLKTAKAIGLSIPATVLARADEVID